MIFQLIVLILSVIMTSALCSMVEAAMLSLNIVRAKMLLEKGHKNAADLLYIKEHIHDTVASIVIINNAINIIGAFFVGEKVTEIFGHVWLGLSAFIFTLLVIVFGEVIPKTVGERYKLPMSLFFAKPVRILVFILSPLVKLILSIEIPLMKRYKMQMPRVTEE